MATITLSYSITPAFIRVQKCIINCQSQSKSGRMSYFLNTKAERDSVFAKQSVSVLRLSTLCVWTVGLKSPVLSAKQVEDLQRILTKVGGQCLSKPTNCLLFFD